MSVPESAYPWAYKGRGQGWGHLGHACQTPNASGRDALHASQRCRPQDELSVYRGRRRTQCVSTKR